MRDDDEGTVLLAWCHLRVLFFYVLFGSAILNPINISWLLQSNDHDSAQHFIGWEFFRNEHWHFPFGIINLYDFPLHSSIVYTDSIPLFAVLFKCFSAFLPSHFQYFGIWYAICYMLQGIFSWKLSEYLTHNFKINIIITGFFLLSPIMLNRVVEHQALVAHWLILAGLFLYIRHFTKTTLYYWLGLNVIAVLTHAYLAAMVLMIWLAYLLKMIFIEHKASYLQIIFHLMINLLILWVVAWLAGYFVVPFGHNIESDGYTLKSMNLIAPIIPGNWTPIIASHWSIFLNPNDALSRGQQYEGFNYLGMGILFLLMINSICLIQFKSFILKNTTLKNWLPLVVIAFLLFVFSLSNRIGFGTHILFSYSLPNGWAHVADTFRASGRFFWPEYYLIMFMIFLLLIKYHQPKKILLLLILAFILQASDLSPKFAAIYHHFHYAPATFEQNFLKNMDPKYDKIIFVPQVARPKANILHYETYTYFAATHHMAINDGYVARQDTERAKQFGKQVLQEIMAGQWMPNTIYVILKPTLFLKIKDKIKDKKIIKFDDYYVIV